MDQTAGFTSNEYPQISYGNASRNSANFTQPYKQNSGVTRGARIIANTDGSKIIEGKLPNLNQFGIGYYDTTGRLTSESTGTFLKFFDNNGVGLAQFGQYPNGSTALKIAAPNIEVSTATDQQLVFNSNKSFTVALQDSYIFPSLGSIPDSTFATSAVVPIPHGVGFIPNVEFFSQKYLSDNPYSPSSPVVPTGYPLSKLTQVSMGDSVLQVDTSTGDAFFQLWLSYDKDNLYLGLGFTNFTGITVVAAPITIYYTVYTLPATATT